MAAPLKICFAAAEMAPFAKTGGLADVLGALPRQLQAAGHDVRVFMPLYAGIDARGTELHRVEFIRDVDVRQGPRELRFSAWTAKQPGAALDVYFIDCPEMFHRGGLYTEAADEPERFALLSRAALACCQRMAWAPDVVHCHDWHTALIPLLLRTVYAWDALFSRTRTVLTIHNIGYQGLADAGLVDRLGLGEWRRLFDQQELAAGRVGLLRTGLLYADLLTTVSPTYAREILEPPHGMGLEPVLRARAGTLVGILNGIDTTEWDPEHDPHIPHPYSRERPAGKRENKRHLLGELGLDGDLGAPLAGVVSRLVHQKGFDVAFDVLPVALARTEVRLAVLGGGEARYEEFFQRLARRFPGRVCFYRGYNHALAHLIEAGADLFLMPSRYEPCGLNQMFGMRYGTLPLVHRTGGLADTVVPHLPGGDGTAATGFAFEHFTPEGLEWALGLALETWRAKPLWRRLMDNAMGRDFSWQRQARIYDELYRRLAA